MKTSKQRRGIGFTNFRRFENFPLLNFSPITYMVGKNNSGKSTMVKALLLVLDYLQYQLSDTFSFESNVLEDVNIVTFGRAKNNANSNPTISYQFHLDEFHFHIEINGNEESTEASVLVLKIEDSASGVTIEINHLKGEVIVSRTTIEDQVKKTGGFPLVAQLEKAVDSLKEDLDSEKDKKSAKAFRLQSDYQKALDKLKDAKKIKNVVKSSVSNNYKVSYSLSAIFGEENQNDDNPLAYIFERLLFLNEINSKKSAKEIGNLANVVALNRSTSHLNDCVDRIIAAIENEQYFYIAANPTKQSALFYLRDKKNALAQAIHKFYQLGITTQNSENEELRFVQNWMRSFDVGYDLDIKFVAGEAYRVNIYETEANKKKGISSHLADKGMGSLQVMTLILRIASIIREKKKLNRKNKVFTILIEEPELNLHPSLQSQLTVFFHEVFSKYGFNFLVETHSEYIIRKSQLLGLQQEYFSKDELNINPFRIFYFHKEIGPYEMKFNSQGKFDKDFGKGFYDEAAGMTMNIINEIRKRQ